MEKEMEHYDFPYIWIERAQRAVCLPYTAPATGIRITYDEGIDPQLIARTDELLKYLRKTYYFPVRCNIEITNHRRYKSREDGHIFYGTFMSNEDICPKRKLYPRIAVAGQLWKHLSVEDVHFTLLHELTHYFQWFFAEDKKGRTDRSLQREANDWARYILCSFQNQE